MEVLPTVPLLLTVIGVYAFCGLIAEEEKK